MFIVDVISRIVHVLTAVTLIGGSIFMLLVLKPSVQELTDEAHKKLHSAVIGRWKRFVHLGVLLFLVTGFYNYIQAVPNHKGDGLYHALLGTKMLLAFGIFFLASALVGRSPKLEPIRQNRGKWLKVLVAMAVAIICISGFVKVRPYESNADKTPTTFSSERDTKSSDSSKNAKARPLPEQSPDES